MKQPGFVRKGYAETPKGQIHFKECGIGKPVLLFHQTPRSSDEYRDILPILGEKFRTLAVDTIGFGDSYRPSECTIEELANGMVSFVDAMHLDRVSVVGHHTGAVVGLEFATSHPERVEKLVLSACPFNDPQKREEVRSKIAGLDEIDSREDGSHLQKLWNGRRSFYPKNRPDLLNRFVIDAMKAGAFAAKGHQAVVDYNMEGKFKKVSCPTLAIAGTEDPFAYPDLPRVARAIAGSISREIKGGTVAMIDQMPEEIARVLMEFL